MPFADAHCHLDFEVFDSDRTEIIEQCAAADIVRLIVPGVTRETWARVLKLAGAHLSVEPCLGLHPYFLAQHQDSDLDVLESLLFSHDEVVAVGEIGLDVTIGNMARQMELVEHQIQLANRFCLPVVMHSRKTHDQLLKIIRRNPLVAGGLLHGFSGSKEQAMAFWREGVFLGVGGVISYERAHKTKAAFSQLPLKAIMLETDSPDMPLCGQQGGRNTPMNVLRVYSELCALRAESQVEIASQLWENVARLFGSSNRHP